MREDKVAGRESNVTHGETTPFFTPFLSQQKTNQTKSPRLPGAGGFFFESFGRESESFGEKVKRLSNERGEALQNKNGMIKFA